jgi:phosphoserine phosphatase RsbU/P
MFNNQSNKISLRTTLVVPFVAQLLAAVGLVGWLSFLNSQKAVEALAGQLVGEVSDRIDLHLDTYLTTPQQINQLNLFAVDEKLVSLENSQQLERYFWKQMQVFPNISYINFANAAGEFVGVGREDNGAIYTEIIDSTHLDQFYRYALNSQGRRGKFLQAEPYNPRQDDWYTDAIAAQKPVWSAIYQWDDRPEVFSISSSYPIYNQSKQLVGVIGVDHILSQTSDFLKSLQVSPSGRVWVLERDGLVVASSAPEPPYIRTNNRFERLNALDSQDPLIQSATRYLVDRFGNLGQIRQAQRLSFGLQGERQFLQVLPWQDEFGLDWLVVIAVPESDFMEQINQNTRNTIFLCLMSLGTAIAIGALTARWITRPIQRVSQAVEEVSKGNLDQQVDSSSIVEINSLSTSFNSMAGQLKESFDALQIAKENYRGIFENALEGIFQSIPGGGFVSINPALARIYGYDSPEEMMDSITNAGQQLYVHASDREEFRHLIHSQGFVQDFEFQSYRKDGSIVWLQMGARAVRSNDAQVLYYEGIVQDITHQKRQKEILEAMVEERTADLAEANREISNLNEKLQSENLRMGAELSVVRRLQQMILPKEEELSQIGELDIAGFMQPADEVGGDYYDVLRNNGLIKIGIGDVTGHGLESGMLMLMTQTAVRTLLEYQEVDSTQFFNAVNRVIYENANRMNCSKNLTLSLLDYRNGCINVSGYHEDVIVIRSDGAVERIDTLMLGLPIGLEADITPFIAEKQVKLHTSDVVVLYTDGITEAENEHKEQYGIDRLCEIVSQHRNYSANEIRQAVIDDVQHHLGVRPIRDDLTLLILKQR